MEPPYVGCYEAALRGAGFIQPLRVCSTASMPEADSDDARRFAGRGTNRPFYLPRLPREHHQGDAVVHWTLPIALRQKGWLDERFHSAFRELMLHTATREGLFCPVYCLMPDHLHLVWMGLRLDTDQLNGMAFLRTHLKSKLAPQRFQHQAHDHVRKPDERRRTAFATTCLYDLENPVRAGLVQEASAWAFTGAIIPGYPTLHPLQEGFWQQLWKLYAQVRHPDAGNIRRPPLS
jgi:putative transposase